MRNLSKLIIALALLAFCSACTTTQGDTANTSGVKILTDADYKRIGVVDRGDPK
jgi:hypothetical protein